MVIQGSSTEDFSKGKQVDPIKNLEINDRKKANTTISKVVPWIIGLSILTYLIWRIKPQPLIEALLHTKLSIYVPSLVVFVYLSFLVDTQNLRALLNSFDYKLNWNESKIIRGASYLIMVVDYTLGLGSVVYFLKASNKIPIVRGTALMMYFNYICQIALFVLMFSGYLMMDVSFAWLNKGMLIFLTIVILSIIIIAVLKYSKHKLVMKVHRISVMKPFVESSIVTYTNNLVYRVGYYFINVLFSFVAIQAFNMNIPFMDVLFYVPLILLIISIPVSPFGLGTAQASMLYLFKDYGSQPQILAFSLVYSVTVVLLRSLLGAYYFALMIRKNIDSSTP